MIRKNILFTFDYELFLGKRSGTVERCLIAPTKQILEILKLHDAKGIFFVDTTYLLRLKEVAKQHQKAALDYEKVSSQIKEIARTHFICPHIHPHWLNAKYLEELNQWDLSDITFYRFHNLNEQERAPLFESSVHIIREILGNASYPIDAFRAGGWCIQPFEDFKPSFESYGIHYDFSVLRGMKNFSEAQFYDFENAPPKDIYEFEQDPTLEKEGGRFREYCISTVSPSPFSKLTEKFLLKYLWKMGDRYSGDGFSVHVPNAAAEQSSGIEMISVELLNLVKFRIYLRFLQRNDYMHFISHPKMLSQHNLSIFGKFMKKIYSTYEIETNYHNMIAV